MSNLKLKNKIKKPTELTNGFSKSAEKHVAALITCRWFHHKQPTALVLANSELKSHLCSPSIDRDGMCRLRPGGEMLGGGSGVGGAR